jgi:hypothetical protein
MRVVRNVSTVFLLGALGIAGSCNTVGSGGTVGNGGTVGSGGDSNCQWWQAYEVRCSSRSWYTSFSAVVLMSPDEVCACARLAASGGGLAGAGGSAGIADAGGSDAGIAGAGGSDALCPDPLNELYAGPAGADGATGTLSGHCTVDGEACVVLLEEWCSP